MRTVVITILAAVILGGTLTGCTGEPVAVPATIRSTPAEAPSPIETPAPTGTSTASPAETATAVPAVPSPVTGSPNGPSTWIVTPDSLGLLRLGMPWAEAEPLLSGYRKQSVRDCPNTGHSSWSSSDEYLQFQIDNAGSVIWIQASVTPDTGPSTPGGLRGGSTVEQLKAEYPEIEQTIEIEGFYEDWAVRGGSGHWLVFPVSVETDATQSVYIGPDDKEPYEVCG